MSAGSTKVSCTGCRAIKTKCITCDPPREKCQRCARLNIPCVVVPHQRGRRRKEQPSKRQRTSTDVARTSWRRSMSSSSNSDRLERENTSADIGEPAHSVYHAVADRSSFSIAGVMSKDHSAFDTSPLSMVSPRDDPVALGLLSMEEAESLFNHYFEQLQTCVCQLDPAIHNAHYTRNQSLALFSAVLSVSSKFFRPELYEPLLGVAERLVGQAMYACVVAIEVVQAICLLHYWKKPVDSSGWLRLGHAIRLAYQLDLHLPRKGDMPMDERDARLIVNGHGFVSRQDLELTKALFCFDSTMTELFDRPSMMHQAPDVAAWRWTIPYSLPSDGQLEFAVKTSTLSAEIRQLQQCKASYEVLRSGLKRISEDLHRSYRSLTSDSARIKLTSTSSSIVRFSLHAQQLLIECTLLANAPRKHRVRLLHICVATSLQMLDIVVDDFAHKGVMPMIEDAHSVAVASAAARLIRFLACLDRSARSAVLRKLTRIVVVCREAARGDHGSHPAYLARFVHALIDNAQSQSRAVSRATSPRVPASDTISPEVWWEELNKIVTQEPARPMEEQQSFWGGFPMLAGAMNTAPLVPEWDAQEGATLGEDVSWPVDSHWDFTTLFAG